MVTVFKYYSDWLLPAPLLSIMSIALLFGIFGWVCFINNRLKYFNNNLEYFFVTMLASGLVAHLSFCLSFFDYSSIIIIRIFGLLILIGSPMGIICFLNRCKSAAKHIKNMDKVSILVLLILVLYLFLSLAPPTDADSFDYHLALPHMIMNKDNSAWNFWLHLRTIGVGEYLNLFGQFMGTDNFGSILQWFSLLGCTALFYRVVSIKFRAWICLIVVSTPVLLFLIPTQKPQMLPEVMLLFSFYYLFFDDSKRMHPLLLIINVYLAMAFKYSFYLSGAVLILWMFYQFVKKHNFWRVILWMVLVYLLFLFPYHVFKFYYFGDPISPLLEGYTNKSSLLLWYASHLAKFTESTLPFPLSIVLPSSFGKVSTVLGLIALIWLLVSDKLKTFLKYPSMIVTIIVTLLYALFSQHTARFFLGSTLWGLLSICVLFRDDFDINKKWKVCILGQSFIIFLFLGYAFFMISPGIFTDGLRDRVMNKFSNGYLISKWLDKILPSNAQIMTSLRYKLFLPRNFHPIDGVLNADSMDAKEFVKRVVNFKISHIVISGDGTLPFSSLIPGCLAAENTRHFKSAVRNPFNKSTYTISVVPISCYEVMNTN